NFVDMTPAAKVLNGVFALVDRSGVECDCHVSPSFGTRRYQRRETVSSKIFRVPRAGALRTPYTNVAGKHLTHTGVSLHKQPATAGQPHGAAGHGRTTGHINHHVPANSRAHLF